MKGRQCLDLPLRAYCPDIYTVPWVDKVTEDEKLDCCSSCLYRRSTSLPTKLIIISVTFQVQVLKQKRLYVCAKTHFVVSFEAGNVYGITGPFFSLRFTLSRTKMPSVM